MTIWLWIGFVGGVVALLAIDLGVFNRREHEIHIREALAWTLVWVVLSLLFNVLVYFMYEHHWLGIGHTIGHELGGHDAALKFLTGYLLEKSLSLDNIFIIALIFAYFRVPLVYQHRVLFWGVLGALVMRGGLIALGTALIHQFWWITYVFGGLLLLTAVKMIVVRHDNLAPQKNPLVRLARRWFPVTDSFAGRQFFTRCGGALMMTPLCIVLLTVESSDLLFAVDSVPAIFAVTDDPFIVFTSNICAILGLRSLYFALAGMMHRFRYLKTSLVFLLVFVGVKMLLAHHHPLPTAVSLVVIVSILVVGLLASIVGLRRDTAPIISPLVDELERLAGWTYRGVRRLVILVIGCTVVLVGIVMIALPGPATLVVPLGLVILATEFAWARWLLRRVARTAKNAMGRITK